MDINDEMIETLIIQLTREMSFPLHPPQVNKQGEVQTYYISSVMSMSEEKHIKEKAKEIIKEWSKNLIDIRISQLEAKCYAYEAIIANSNFAPAIKTNKIKREKN